MSNLWSLKIPIFVIFLSFVSSSRADERLIELRRDVKLIETATSKVGDALLVVDTAERLLKNAPAILASDSTELASSLELVAQVFHQVFRYEDEENVLKMLLIIRQVRYNASPNDDARVHLARVRFSLGRVVDCRGDRVVSKHHYEIAISVLPLSGEKRDELFVSICNAQAINDGIHRDVSSALSRFEKAIVVAESLARKDAYKYLLAILRTNYGTMLIAQGGRLRASGDIDGASRAFQKASALIVQAGRYYNDRIQRPGLTAQEGAEFLNTMLMLNQYFIAIGNFSKAEESLERMLKSPDSVLKGRLLGATFHRTLGRAKFALGKIHESIQEYRSALTILKRYQNSHAISHEIVFVKSELARILGFASLNVQDHTEAKTLARESVTELLQIVASGFAHQNDLQRVSYLASVNDILGLHLALDDSVNVYDLVIAWKGIATAQKTSDRVTGTLLLCRSTYEHAVRAYEDWGRLNRPKTVNESKWRDLGIRLRNDCDRAEKLLFEETGKSLKTDLVSPTAHKLSDSLPEDSAFIDYVVYDHPSAAPISQQAWADTRRIIAFISRRNKPTVRVLIKSDVSSVSKLVTKWNSEYDAKAKENLRQELSQALWFMVEKHLDGVTRVFLSPDEILWRVPFAAFPGRVRRFLVQELVLVHVFSGRHAFDLCSGSGVYSLPMNIGCQVIGNIRYGMPNQPPSTKDLVAGKDWVDEVMQDVRITYPNSVSEPLCESQAIASCVLSSFESGVRDIRLLGHGPEILRDLNSPPLAKWEVEHLGMPLAASDGADKVTARVNCPDAEQLASLDLRGVSTFFWWGCELNKGSIRSGEGVIGLPRALQLAGCRAVLSSQLLVNDSVARNISKRVDRFHWYEGQSAAEALSNAQREAIEGDELFERQPELWAGWIMIGDSPSPRTLVVSTIVEKSQDVERFPTLYILVLSGIIVLFSSIVLVFVFIRASNQSKRLLAGSR